MNSSNAFSRSLRSPFAIALLLFGFRLLLILCAQDLSGDDGLRYLQEAVNLVQHSTFSHEASAIPTPTAHDLPGFPLATA
jgi:hypothetical protein